MQTAGLRGARLSIQQDRLWSFLQKTQDTAAYAVQNAIWLRGKLHESVLLQKVQVLAERHEIFQTVFDTLPGMDVAVQVIGRHPQVGCALLDLESFPPSVQHALLDANFEILRTQPFDLAHGPLLQAILFRLSTETSLLLLRASALCADTATFPLFVDELLRLYEADCTQREAAGEEEPLQYTAVSAWQNELLESEEAEEALAFWQRAQTPQAVQLTLPFNAAREKPYRSLPSSQNQAEQVLPFYRCLLPVDEALAEQIQRVAGQYHVAPETLCYACWQLTLWRLTGNADLVTGVACHGRDDEELTDVLGLYTRYVPLGLSFSPQWTFEQVLASAQQALDLARRWQYYFTWPLSDKTSSISGARDSFPLAFAYQNWSASTSSGELALSLYRSIDYTEPFVLKLHVLQTIEGLQFEIHYDPAFLSDEQVVRLGKVYHNLCAHAVTQPEARVNVLQLLSVSEQSRLCEQFRAPQKPLSASGLHQLFEEQASQYPRHIAVLDNMQQLSYQELNARANQLARVLRSYGIGPNVLVGLCLPRSVEMIVAILALFKVGGGYVPLDPESPAARLEYQLHDARLPLLLTVQEQVARLPEWGGQILALEQLQEAAEREDAGNLNAVGSPEDIAYIIYTSGSTGQPKGVVVHQRNIVNYSTALREFLRVEPGWSFATVSTLAADLGNTAIFCALVSGGCLHIPDYETITSAEALARWSMRTPIDVLKIVPSHLAALLADEHAASILPRRALICGGEAFPPGLLRQIQTLGARCEVYNHYGPTETTIGVLVNRLAPEQYTAMDGENVRSAGPIPLGRPLTNAEIYVLDAAMQPVPLGVTGELYIGGAGLASGYIHQQAQTAERFIPHPFSTQPGARLYRTGDLVRANERGQIEFLGRRDSQVKLRGYRIELGEIETLLRQHHNIWDSAVALREDIEGHPQLVGYVVARKQPAPAPEELRTFLRERVAEYMIPSHFLLLKALPLSANGKLDRRQLPKPEVSAQEARTALVLPRTPIEEMLLVIWKELLGLAEIGIHENFFHLGGHSLLATQVISRVRNEMQVELSIQSLFEHATIAELGQQIEQLFRGASQEQVIPLVSGERSASLPLSFAQQRLWFLDQLEPGSIAYLIPRALRIRGPLHVEILRRSLAEIARRHENLRTTFQEQKGQPVQVIHPAGPLALPVVDLRALSEDRREQCARQLADSEARFPCDLMHGPLLRAYLLALDTQEHVFLLTMHHIISDGWSNGVFERELLTLYKALSAGKPASLPPLPIQYADFALWQRRSFQEGLLTNQLAYWKQQLTGALPLDLPTDHPRPPKQTFRGASCSLHLPASLQEELARLSQREGVTLFMLLLAAFQVLLLRYTGQEDISIGTPIANRTRAELEGLIGFFVNTLVLRADLSGNPSFRQLLQRVRRTALEAYAHQDVPFEHLVDMLQPARDLSRAPLFQVMFAMQQAQAPATQREGELSQVEELSFSALSVEHTATKFDLTLSLMSSEQGLRCDVEYNTDLFEVETVHRLLEHWHMLLDSIVASPQAALSDLEILAQEERQRVLTEWNPLAYTETRATCLHALFEQQVAQRPEAIALVYGEEALTYSQLNARANQLASALRKLGVGPGMLVGLVLERSPLLMIGVLGVLKARGTYIPLDPAYPVERLEFMLTDSQAALLLTQQTLLEHVPAQGRTVVCLDTDWSTLAEEPEQNSLGPGEAEAELAAYIIYTSGSTGKPKGVVVTHANVFHLFAATWPSYHFTENDTWTLFHSYAFDFSIWEMWGALLYGGRLVVVPYEVSRTPEVFADLLSTHGVTVLNQTPSAFRQLIQVDASSPICQQSLALRLIIFGGEALDLQSLRPWFERHGEETPLLVNMYGITETTVHVTYRPLSLRDLNASGSVIGKPIPSLQVYVLDEHLRPTPIGVPGQMYVGGAGVSNGYLRRPELTGERFIPHPFSTRPGTRLYATGDRARFLPNGDLDYLGRIDQQVKIRGFRIELGEIEEELSRYPEVHECRVLARTFGEGERRLIAYVIPREDTFPRSSELRRFLLQTLPEYMVPAFFVALEAFPLTTNGKLDQRMLPLPGSARPDLEEAFVRPGTITEEILAGAWAVVLGIEQVGIHDNFFTLGGDSMRSIQVLAQARERGVNFSLQQLFQHQTIYELARVVEAQGSGLQAWMPTQPFSLLSVRDRQRLPATVEDAYPLVKLQAGMLFHSQYAPEEGMYHDIFSYHLQAPFHQPLLQQALHQMVDAHPVLRTAFDLSSYSEPLQLVYLHAEIPLQTEDLCSLSFEEQEDMIVAWMEAEKQQPFDWTRAPLLRVVVHLRGDQAYQFSLCFHHAILDGWSVAALLTELFERYMALVQTSEALVSSPLATTFRDFVALEQEALASEEARHYWGEELSGCGRTQLPREAPVEQESILAAKGLIEVPISDEVAQGLHKLARQAAVPIKSVLLAAHLNVLRVLSGGDDVLTGLVTNGRPETTDGEKVLGLFLNTLPHRQRLSGGSWLDLVRETFECERRRLPWQRYPLAQIQRQHGKQALFETSFNFLRFHVYERLESIQQLQVLGSKGFTRNNFVLVADFRQAVASQQLQLHLECDVSQLTTEQSEALAGYYSRTLTAMATSPTARYELHSILSIEEQQSLTWWNATRVEVAETYVHQLIEAQAERTSDALAVVYEDEQLTYAELNRRANRLAHHLQACGVGPEVRVGLCMERSLDLVINTLAILKAGGVYVPLDPAYPVERLAFMLANAQTDLVVTMGRLRSRVSEVCLQALHTRSTEMASGVAYRVLYAESMEEDQFPSGGKPEKIVLGSQAGENPVSQLHPDNLAYMMYTSGSTGTPKGAMITHKGLLNYLLWAVDAYEVSSGHGAPLASSLSFDLSVTALFPPLLVGCAVTLLPEDMGGERLAEVLNDPHHYSLVKVTPAHLQILSQQMVPEQAADSTRCFVIGGEQLTYQTVDLWRTSASQTRLINEYGPTETVVGCCVYEVRPDDALEGAVPIGRPIANTHLYVLDEQMQPVPVGVGGELFIGGMGVARGYGGRPELTAQRFVPDPFAVVPGARLYRTGDLAKYRQDGTLVYLGRIDRQVKLNGYRVELGEIEVALLEHPAVTECVTLIQTEPTGNQRLVAYIVHAQTEAPPTVRELDDHLRQKLPQHMVPSAYIFLDALPLTPNGKVDQQSLPLPTRASTGVDETVTLARTPTEELLSAIWSSVLGVEQVGVQDNFFALGGDSIRSIQVVAQARQHGLDFSLQQLFECQTIEELAHVARTREKDVLLQETLPAWSLVSPIDRQRMPDDVEDAYPLAQMQAGMLFHSQYNPESAVYHNTLSYHLRVPFDQALLRQSLDCITREQPMLRTSFDLSSFSEPLQLVHHHVEIPLQVDDLSLYQPQEQEARVDSWLGEEKQRAFSWERPPLLSVQVHVYAEQSFQLTLSFHHAIFDGWSVASLLNDLFRVYLALLKQEALPTRSAPMIQFRHFIALERQLLTSPETQDYWRVTLDGSSSTLLPRWASGSGGTEAASAHSRYLSLSLELSLRLKRLAQQCVVPLKSVLLAAHLRVLKLLSGQDDVLTGVVSDGRPEMPGSERVLGLFLNTLPLRARVAGGTWQELVHQTFASEREMLPHRWYPFAEIQKQQGQPLFEAVFNFGHFHVLQDLVAEGNASGTFKVQGRKGFERTNFPLFVNFSLNPLSSEISLMLQWDTTEFGREQIEALETYYLNVLTAMAEVPTARYELSSPLSLDEQEQLLRDWNATATEYPREQTIHQLFERQAISAPDTIAVVFDDEHLSYGALNQRAGQLAIHLNGLGANAEHPIGLCIERSVEMLIGMLGILKAGCAYLPLDPAYPVERLAYMLENSHTSLVVTQATLLALLPEKELCPVLLPLATDPYEPGQERYRHVEPEQLAYIIYTSGSTGLPKGTMISHRAVVNFFNGMSRQPGIDAQDIVVALTSLSFDIAVLELLVPLLCGSRVVILSQTDSADGHLLAQRIAQSAATLVQATPASWRLLLSAQWTGQAGLKLLCGGEAFPQDLSAQLWEKGASLWNMYGPTETTIWSATRQINAQDERITIGRPIANTQIYLLDAQNAPVPVGVAGELYIGGDGLARGYLRRADLTAERFLPDPFSKGPGARMYRTGDLARWLSNGTIECLGRIDHQVKIRGFRIELGEVEATLAQHPLIQEAVVVRAQEEADDTRLAAYVVPALLTQEQEPGVEVQHIQEEQVSNWAAVWDQTYHETATAAEPFFNIAGWNSSYTGAPIPAEEMREWVEHTVRRILALQPRNVLEIGCGTGLLLFRVAQQCEHYTGCDFSPTALASIREQAYTHGYDLSHVSLYQSAADDFSYIADQQYDLVILNSVVQYFPDLAYLRRVLEQASRIVRPGGSIFIGDVRNLLLLEAFHVSVQLVQADPALPLAQFQALIREQITKEQELVIDPAFFSSLADELPQVSGVEVELKRGQSENELTCFRYDVILRVGEQERTPAAQPWLDWQAQGMTCDALQHMLQHDAPALLCFSDVPNARLTREVRALRQIAQRQADSSLGELLQALNTRPSLLSEPINPETFYALGDACSYTVEVFWPTDGSIERYHVILYKNDLLEERGALQAMLPRPNGRTQSRPYSNTPLLARFLHNPVAQLRAYLQEKLPVYMVPSLFVVLDKLPLTSNGKVDRRALPRPTGGLDQSEQQFVEPRTPLEEVLAGFWKDVLGLQHVGIYDNFFELGGHSLLATRLISRLQAVLQIRLPLRSVFEAPRLVDLARRVEQALRGERRVQPPLLAGERPQLVPLSFEQQRLWFLDQLQPGGAAYLMPSARRFREPLDVQLLERGLEEVIQRHESLRTTMRVREGQPVQVIHPAASFRLPVVDLSGLVGEAREEVAKRLIEQEAQRPCDLAQGPLLRVSLIRLEHEDQVLAWTMHHIISDGWSMQIFEREVSAIYQAFAAGQPSPLPPLPIQYADFALWQREWLQGDVLESQIDYWIARLSGAPALELPVDHPRPPVQSRRGAAQPFVLSGELSQALITLGREEGVTLFMLLLAAFQVLLYRYTGQRDIVVGTDSANRNHVETEGLIGFFVNLLALRTRLDGALSFREVLQRVREGVLGAYAHQETPFDVLVEKLAPARTLDRMPLVQALLVLQNFSPIQAFQGERADAIEQELKADALQAEATTVKFDLALFMKEQKRTGQLFGILNYSLDLFEARTIATLIARFKLLLQSIVHDPSQAIDHIAFLTDQERLQNEQEIEQIKGKLRRRKGERFSLSESNVTPDRAEKERE